jgi:hypothetical protein
MYAYHSWLFISGMGKFELRACSFGFHEADKCSRSAQQENVIGLKQIKAHTEGAPSRKFSWARQEHAHGFSSRSARRTYALSGGNDLTGVWSVCGIRDRKVSAAYKERVNIRIRGNFVNIVDPLPVFYLSHDYSLRSSFGEVFSHHLASVMRRS